MPLTNESNPVTIKDLEDLDEHITAVVRRTQQELLTQIEQLRMDVNELKQQVPPKLKNL